jgi:hypothetical protein
LLKIKLEKNFVERIIIYSFASWKSGHIFQSISSSIPSHPIPLLGTAKLINGEWLRITVVQVTGVQSSQSRMDGQNAQSKCSKQIA